MSASKKLEALRQKRNDARRGLDVADAEGAILNALPALIDVVEVAEEYSRAALHWTEDSPRQKRMRVALSALDEALS